jgi:protein-tyrosine phosphatase
VALLRALKAAGFDHVVATPHIRPGMFDNDAASIRPVFEAMCDRLAPLSETAGALPTVELAAEHFFDDAVFARMLAGQALAYGVGRALLVEFFNEALPVSIAARFFDLRLKRLRPVVAHPERYEPFMQKPERSAEQLRRAGGVLLLDLCALVGKYGARAQRTAECLVDAGAYYAACSDAHRPSDGEETAQAIVRLRARAGGNEVERLLRTGPREILEGRIVDEYD